VVVGGGEEGSSGGACTITGGGGAGTEVVVSLVVVPQALTRLTNATLNTPIAERLVNFIFLHTLVVSNWDLVLHSVNVTWWRSKLSTLGLSNVICGT
jgi:hypothetical protein